MKWFLLILAAATVCAFPADKKKGDVQILVVKALRDGTDVTVDGRLRATAEKPILDLVLEFDFLGPNKKILTTRKFGIDEHSLENGDEAAFHASTTYPPNAIAVLLRAYVAGDRELTMVNPGPFPIEE